MLAEGRKQLVGLKTRDGRTLLEEGAQVSELSGQRVPIELTSLGRAWLAAAPLPERNAMLKQLAQRRSDWPALRREIGTAIEHVQQFGWCSASWQPEVIAVSTPLLHDNERGYVLNASISSSGSPSEIAAELSMPLLALAGQIARAFEAAGHGGGAA